jgi:hypothetical protein
MTLWPGQLSNKGTSDLAQCSAFYRFPTAFITIEKNAIILLAIMIVKSRMVQETIYDYWVLGWQLTGPRNLAQVVTRLTTRNGPDLNLGPVTVNRKVIPSHATKTCRGSTSTAALILNLCARLFNFTPRPPCPTNYPDKLFTVSFRHQANVEILYIQRPLPFRSLNSSFGIETTLRNGLGFESPQGQDPKRTDCLWDPPSCFCGG